MIKLDDKQNKLLEEAQEHSTYVYGALKLIKDLNNKDVKPGLLKQTEINLHYAHEAMRELNKDIFSDMGQEYPIPIAPTEEEKNND